MIRAHPGDQEEERRQNGRDRFTSVALASGSFLVLVLSLLFWREQAWLEGWNVRAIYVRTRHSFGTDMDKLLGEIWSQIHVFRAIFLSAIGLSEMLAILSMIRKPRWMGGCLVVVGALLALLLADFRA